MLDFDRFEVISFDCYGTLIDWEAGISAALTPLLERHGVELSNDELLAAYARLEAAAEAGEYRSYRQVLARVVEGLGEEHGFAPDATERSALAESLGDWPPFPDTVAALAALARRFRLAILSNVDDDLFARTAERLEVPFDLVVTAQQVGSYKPSRSNFERLLERVRVPRERLLHAAQSLFHDVAPARELGIATVWVNRRHHRPGTGATPPAEAVPDLEVPDLATLARTLGCDAL